MVVSLGADVEGPASPWKGLCLRLTLNDRTAKRVANPARCPALYGCDTVRMFGSLAIT